MGSNKQRSGKNNRHKSNRASFVAGGILSDFQINGSDSPSSNPGKSPNDAGQCNPSKSRRSDGSASAGRARRRSSNPFRYEYPTVDFQELRHSHSVDVSDASPIVLVESNGMRIVGHEERTPCFDHATGETFVYEYGSSSVLGDSCHQGLGLYNEKVEADDGEEDEQKPQPVDNETGIGKHAKLKGKPTAKRSNLKRNDGFLSIGSVKLYTEDVKLSDDDDGENDETEMDVDGETSESDETSYSESAGSFDCDEDEKTDSCSDIDDAVAEDYLDGIGGGSELLNSEWLVGRKLNDEGSTSSSSSSNESLEKLGGTALEIASQEYGMKKPKSRKKNQPSTTFPSLALYDDLLLVKDPRTALGRKKHDSQLAHSWPSIKMKNRNAHGEKKKHRKELIAVKRRERMLRHGVDLEQINLKLRQMVIGEVDTFAFEPMHFRDCSQVQRLASIYRLRSGRQGPGKKRFVIVTRTEHTCLPSASDKLRLEKLLAVGNEDEDFVLSPKTPMEKLRGKKRTEIYQSARSKLIKNSSNHKGEGSRKKNGGRSATNFANQPVSFVSSGIMQVDSSDNTVVDLGENGSSEMKTILSSTRLGEYEMHTKGFGSKMLAKMGFVEGSGLGKEGQGMVEPIEAIQRPKSLGLGVDFHKAAGGEGTIGSRCEKLKGFEKHSRAGSSRDAMSNGSSRRGKPEQMGAFEKHTKGFGSRMMARMGFVGGAGLGKDGQGIVEPLAAVKLPKSRGLGTKG